MQMKSQSPEPSLLPQLRLVEIGIITRYLNARQKLTIMRYLNKAWNMLILKPYAWHCFPDSSINWPIQLRKDFLKWIPDLNGIIVHSLPIQEIYKLASKLVMTKELGVYFHQFSINQGLSLLQNKPLMKKIGAVQANLSQQCTEKLSLFLNGCNNLRAFSLVGATKIFRQVMSDLVQCSQIALDLVRDVEVITEFNLTKFKKMKSLTITARDTLLNLKQIPPSLKTLKLYDMGAENIEYQLSNLHRLTTLECNLKNACIPINCLPASIVNLTAYQLSVKDGLSMSAVLPNIRLIKLKYLTSPSRKCYLQIVNVPNLSVCQISKCWLSLSIENAPCLKHLEIGSNFLLRMKNGITSSILKFLENPRVIKIQGLCGVLKEGDIRRLKLTKNIESKESSEIYYFLASPYSMEELAFVVQDLNHTPSLCQNQDQLQSLKKLDLVFSKAKKQILIQKMNLLCLKISKTSLYNEQKFGIIISHLCRSILQINVDAHKSSLTLEIYTSLEVATIVCKELRCRFGQSIKINKMKLYSHLLSIIQSLQCCNKLSLNLAFQMATLHFEFDQQAKQPFQIQLFKACRRFHQINYRDPMKCSFCNENKVLYAHMDFCKYWSQIRENLPDSSQLDRRDLDISQNERNKKVDSWILSLAQVKKQAGVKRLHDFKLIKD